MRRAWFVDQSVSSKARRAAAMARCISAADASATAPSTSSVAGLTFSKVAPESASTSAPSMSIRVSGWTVGAPAEAVAVMAIILRSDTAVSCRTLADRQVVANKCC